MSAKLYALITRANHIISDATPIPADCGQLCGAACCKGDDSGMLLFPGEAARLANVQGFKVSRIKYMDGRAWLLTCNRDTRPLSCRIFPLAPHVGDDGTVTAISDPRARRMCPLATGEYLDRNFKKRVGKVFELLSREPKMLEFMRMISAELVELNKFFI